MKLISLILLFLCVPLMAAEQKEALVIGFTNYDNITPLPLVATDMRDVASSLERLGFHVTRVPDPVPPCWSLKKLPRARR